MDYEKKYKEALVKAREVYHRGYYMSGDMENIFPELKESDDDMIRKALIRVLYENVGNGIEKYGAKLEDALAWIEKQDEQTPAWSEEDEIGLIDAMWAIEQARTIAKNENDMGNLWYAENWLKSIKDRMNDR